MKYKKQKKVFTNKKMHILIFIDIYREETIYFKLLSYSTLLRLVNQQYILHIAYIFFYQIIDRSCQFLRRKKERKGERIMMAIYVVTKKKNTIRGIYCILVWLSLL